MCLVLIAEELFLCQALLLNLQALLFLEVTLGLLLLGLLLTLLVFPLLRQAGLLGLVFFLLASRLGGPEVTDGFWLGGHLGRGRGLSFHLLSWTSRESWSLIIFAQKTWWVLRQLGDSD
jgi:hypothetical protein